MTNPYKTLPDSAFWKLSVAEVPTDAICPVVEPVSLIKDGDRVATAGSCFAQKVSKYLNSNESVNFVQLETVSGDQPLYSAKYGNIYTVRQLIQLFDEAQAGDADQSCAVMRDDGKFVDMYRPFMEPEGFDTAEAVVAARTDHLAKVKAMFETVDVFIYTLGLTETWQSKQNGRVYPVCPGIYSAEAVDYEFVNFTFSDIKADLVTFSEKLRGVNADVNLLLTVSPVPLTATYSGQHVLSATTYSKSVLRAVCEEVVQSHDDIRYFPSFEIVSNPFQDGCPFESNLRSVKDEVVERVMRVFDQTMVDESIQCLASEEKPGLRVVVDNTDADEPFCDDVEVEKSIGF